MKLLTLVLLTLWLSACSVPREQAAAPQPRYRVTFADAEFPYQTRSLVLFSEESLMAFKEELLEEGIPLRKIKIETVNL